MYWSLLSVLLLSTLSQAESAPDTTTLPLTYVTATAKDVVDDPAFLDAVRAAPPNVLHLGHVLPLNSIFGPTADFSGWNPKLAPAEEILGRRERIREFVDKLHAAGVERVVCYINPAILGGDHETREGFWALYDHWEDYQALGIGPKPDRDPLHWIQKERQPFGQWAPEPEYPLWLYRPCVNEPGWRRYHEAVVRLVAESGLDGVFVDDCIIECHHDRCREAFAAFLKDSYGRREIGTLFSGDLSLGAPLPLWQTQNGGSLRDAATHLFWQESMRDYLDAITTVARKEAPDFMAIANWGAISRVRGAAGRAQSGKDIEVWKPATSYVMCEEAHPSGYLGPSDAFGYLLQYNQFLTLGIRPIVHSYAATPGQIELGYGECAAGGGGAFVQPDIGHPEIRKKWRVFFESNRELLEGFSLVAPVGLVLAYDELRFNNQEHLRQALATAHELHAAHVPFAAIPKSQLRAGTLSKFRVLILPHVLYLDASHERALGQFAQSGGKVLVAGPCGAYDMQGQRKPTNGGAIFPLVDGLPNQAILSVTSMQELVPQRTFDLIQALDILDPQEFAAKMKALGQPTDRAELAGGATRDLLSVLAVLAGADLSVTRGAPAVRTVLYQRLRKDHGAVTVHAVRYAASIVGGDDPPLAPAPLALDVRVPPGWKVRGATVRDPDLAPQAIPVTAEAQVVHCDLPPFQYYSLLALELGPD
ncbi:MAG: hypothetical protein HYV26_17605 [Candidatus Hydrogenedentes bacterium]|nr:hypothetical protein [Candidatus Hydrogenedentota bacterium]